MEDQYQKMLKHAKDLNTRVLELVNEISKK